ncbi:hypothetical protein [Cytobacillus sp. IB215665]|uniref:hypothetical protein n=1 Tax=Cytobacillus sp. IB215665 TaxID=3097357 RepID=UPI002A0AA909|nr:hypothetical protein [Cytobacillus sp. IB215665]MDX8367817.1 hypothetical protein [Cytobacillus sp. IB215665]
MKKKVQLYVNDNEKEVYALLDQIENEGIEYQETDGETQKVVKRGYVQDRLKEILKTYSIIAKSVGSSEPSEVINKWIQLNSGTASAPSPSKPTTNTIEETERTSNNLKGFTEQAATNFGMD